MCSMSSMDWGQGAVSALKAPPGDIRAWAMKAPPSCRVGARTHAVQPWRPPGKHDLLRRGILQQPMSDEVRDTGSEGARHRVGQRIEVAAGLQAQHERHAERAHMPAAGEHCVQVRKHVQLAGFTLEAAVACRPHRVVRLRPALTQAAQHFKQQPAGCGGDGGLSLGKGLGTLPSSCAGPEHSRGAQRDRQRAVRSVSSMVIAPAQMVTPARCAKPTKVGGCCGCCR